MLRTGAKAAAGQGRPGRLGIEGPQCVVHPPDAAVVAGASRGVGAEHELEVRERHVWTTPLVFYIFIIG